MTGVVSYTGSNGREGYARYLMAISFFAYNPWWSGSGNVKFKWLVEHSVGVLVWGGRGSRGGFKFISYGLGKEASVINPYPEKGGGCGYPTKSRAYTNKSRITFRASSNFFLSYVLL